MNLELLVATKPEYPLLVVEAATAEILILVPAVILAPNTCKP